MQQYFQKTQILLGTPEFTAKANPNRNVPGIEIIMPQEVFLLVRLLQVEADEKIKEEKIRFEKEERKRLAQIFRPKP